MNLILIYFFIFYYFIDAIISTLHVSSFIFVYIDIWHIVTAWYVLMCFSLSLKSTFLATKNVSPPTVFDLGGWNRYHFVGNWIPYTVKYHFFNILSLSSKKRQHKEKICKKCKFFEKSFDLLFKFLVLRNSKNRFVTFCS